MGTDYPKIRAIALENHRSPSVNPSTLHGQAIGGLVQGLGGAFLEHLEAGKLC